MHQDNPFGFGKLKVIRSTEESKALNSITDPCIIISASGMCEAGRIRHHIANNIENPNNTILIIGYQAEGTLGRQLVEKATSVHIFGIEHPVRAEVRVLNSFSAHADKADIMDWLSHIKGVQKLFLVHGEDDQMIPLKDHIQQELHIDNIYMPSRGDVIEL
jgi:metallo-beta-lactamase family protein